MKPQAHFRRILPELNRLAEWHSKHKPTCHSISLQRIHWRAIIDHPEEARAFGFLVSDNSVTYQGFTLSPTDCGTSHGPG